MAFQHRLCPGPDGNAGRRRTDGAARQPEGRAPASGRSRRRFGRPPAGVRAALLALLDHDLRAVRGAAAGAHPDEFAAAARPAGARRDAAPAAPHRAHPADRHAAGRAPDLPQARRGGARPRVDDDGLEARRSGGAGAARADRLGRGELHPAGLSLHRGRAQFRRRRAPLLPDHRQAARPAGRRHAQHRQHRCRRRHHRPHHQFLPPRRRRHLGDAVSRAEVPRGLQRGGRRHPVARRAGPCAAADRIGDARRRHRQSRRPDGRAGGRRPRRRGRDPAQPAPAVRAADRPSARAGVHARRRDLRSDVGRGRCRAAILRTRSSAKAPSPPRRS